jgi:ammonia channel protein AmtB
MDDNGNSYGYADDAGPRFFLRWACTKKNLVSTLAQCFTIFAIITLVWTLWGTA